MKTSAITVILTTHTRIKPTPRVIASKERVRHNLLNEVNLLNLLQQPTVCPGQVACTHCRVYDESALADNRIRSLPTECLFLEMGLSSNSFVKSESN